MSDLTAPSGHLTTHVLDTMSGTPAAGMRITLRRVSSTQVMPVVETQTNADGRCDGPLLEGENFSVGQYELMFHAGEYFRTKGVPLGEPAFLDLVPIRFGISDPDAHIHVPLLISPYAYSTYRGS